MSTEEANVYVIDTKYQLLNAIEATYALGLRNNHLFVVTHKSFKRADATPLIPLITWAQVRFIEMDVTSYAWDSTVFGRRIDSFLRTWYGRALHFQRMRRVSKAIKSVNNVNCLFLGHYWVEYKFYMRHFANSIKHRTLYLIDDGTDTIDINERRKLAVAEDGITLLAPTGKLSSSNPIIQRIRHRYWDWNVAEAARLTFFTTYDLDIIKADKLIRNEYRFLRHLAVSASRTEEVYFLGQCMVGDAYMSEALYVRYLLAVKAYYSSEKVIYISHPRESAAMLARIRESVGFEVRRFNFPIEYELTARGPIPRVVASFFSSALESCFHILGTEIKIVGFYVYPEHLLRMRSEVEGTYAYLEKRVGPNFDIIKLNLPDGPDS